MIKARTTRRAALNALAFFCLASLAPVALAQTSAAAAGSSTPVLLVVGDSLSAEYGLARGTGWVTLLEQRLQREKINHRVVNASISGDTTSGGVNRLPALLKQHQPRVLVVELGANDALRGLSLTMTEANLRKMVKDGQAAGAKVVVTGMQIPPNYGRDYTQRFQALFGKVAKEEKAALVPFLLEGIAEKPEMFQADRLHPLAAAQPAILDNVWPVLAPLVRAK